MIVRRSISGFFRDFADRSAALERSSIKSAAPSSVFMVIAVVGSNLETTRALVVDQFGLPGVAVLPVISLGLLASCVLVISLKEQRELQPGFTASRSGETTAQYRFGRFARNVAKAAFVALLYVVPAAAWTVAGDVRPLPLSFAGVIVDAPSNTPLTDGRVRLVTSDDVDVTNTDETLDIDSSGVFSLTATRRVWRSASVVVHRTTCKPVRFQLWKRFETAIPESLPQLDGSGSPFFRFVANCE